MDQTLEVIEKSVPNYNSRPYENTLDIVGNSWPGQRNPARQS